MNIAIYQYHRQDTKSMDINQSAEKLLLSAVTLCKDKAIELFGDDHTFIPYLDTETDIIASNYMKGAYVRPRLEDLLADIHAGKIDMVVVTYMGAVASDYLFVLAFYIYLRQHRIRLLTVREGEKINEMMDQVLEEYRKNSGL